MERVEEKFTVLDNFNEMAELRHPGSICGFSDNLIANLEFLVNGLLLDTPLDLKKNKLFFKLLYLKGSNDCVYRFKNGKESRHGLHPPILSHEEYCFLDDLRRVRNDHAHATRSVYNIIEQFEDVILKLKDVDEFLFKLQKGKNFLKFNSKSVFTGHDVGLEVLSYSPNFHIDLIPGTVHNWDLQMTVYTEEEHKTENSLFKVQNKKGKFVQVTHFLHITWCSKTYRMGLNATCLAKLFKVFPALKNARKKTVFFKFDVSATFERIRTFFKNSRK